MAATQLAAAGEEHRCAPRLQSILQPLQPLLLQGGKQLVGQGTLQHPVHPGHRHLHPATAGIGQQGGELVIGQGHMGAHQHQPRLAPAIGATAAEGRQPAGVKGLGRQGHQAIEQAGGALKQEASRRLLASSHQRAHRRAEAGELLGPLRIHHHQRVSRQRHQPLAQGRPGRWLQLRQSDVTHRRRRDAPATLLLRPFGQPTGAVAEQAVAGEGAVMHRLTLQQVHPCHRGAPTLQEGRHQEGGLKGPQLLPDHLRLQREMAPQGRIAAAHHQPAVDHPVAPGLRQGGHQGQADLPHPSAGLVRIQGTGVGQQKEQRRRMGQSGRQGLGVPAEQQRRTVHGLGAGGVVVEDDHLEPGPRRRGSQRRGGSLGRPLWRPHSRAHRLSSHRHRGGPGRPAGPDGPWVPLPVRGGRGGAIPDPALAAESAMGAAGGIGRCLGLPRSGPEAGGRSGQGLAGDRGHGAGQGCGRQPGPRRAAAMAPSCRDST